jgi:hypothetical protein
VLAIVFMNTFHGSYSTRFLSASFPFLASTILSFRGAYGFVTVFAYALYTALLWMFWFRVF